MVRSGVPKRVKTLAIVPKGDQAYQSPNPTLENADPLEEDGQFPISQTATVWRTV